MRCPRFARRSSIADPGLPGHLPPGHPFIVDRTSPAIFWSSTTLIDDLAKAVDFDGMFVYYDTKMTGHRVWCVRGGHGHDGKR